MPGGNDTDYQGLAGAGLACRSRIFNTMVRSVEKVCDKKH